MTFKASIHEGGQVTFPKEALDALGLEENSTFEFEVEGSTFKVRPKRDVRAFDAAIAPYMGSKRDEMLAEGYSSVDEYVAVLRPR